MWFIHIMDIYKRSHILRFHLNEIPRIDKSRETESRLVVSRDWGEGEICRDSLSGTEFPFGLIKMFWN